MIARVDDVSVAVLESEVRRGIKQAQIPTPLDGKPSPEPLYVLVCTKAKLAAIGAAFLELKQMEKPAAPQLKKSA